MGNNDEVVEEKDKNLDLVPRKTDLQIKAEQAAEMAKEGKINAFFAVKLTLASMREALEDEKGQPPRWIRIGRVGGAQGEEWKERPVGKAVDLATGAFLQVLGIVAELTLKAKDLLTDVDGAKAMVEVGAEMLDTLSSDEIVKAMAYSVGARSPDEDFDKDGNPKVPPDPSFRNPLAPVATGVGGLKKIMNYIPGPEDLDGVASELYELMKVIYKEEEKLDQTIDIGGVPYQVHVDLEKTGKARLISYARRKPIPIYKSEGFKFDPLANVTYLGSRIVKDVGKPNEEGRGSVGLRTQWTSEGDVVKWDVYAFDYSREADSDLKEVEDILTKLNYEQKSLTDRLKAFQKQNNLPQKDGSLDIYTIHRLMNMDYRIDKGTLKRAEPFKK